MRLVFAFFTVLWTCSSPTCAQQPFVTDDAEVTEKRKLHLEFSNEFDILQRSSFPNLKQNTASFELNYGLFKRLEIGIECPVLTIFNARGTSPQTAFGIGDTNVSAKYIVRRECDGSRWPAMAVGLNFEIPTGDTDRQLGSGLSDFYLNAIFQKSLTERTTLRWNGGVLFAGNTTTGAIGIKRRGTVFTAGGSIVRKFTQKLQLGCELTGAATPDSDFGMGELQTLVGGNYELRKGLTFDFGVVTGRFDASPRLGLQIGFSVDF